MSARRTLALAATLGMVTIAGVSSTAGATFVPVSDGFDRTITAGWGRTPSGESWSTPSGPFSSRVEMSRAAVDLLARRETRASLNGLSLADTGIVTTFVVPDQVAFYGGIESRIQTDGSAYRNRVRVASDGRVELESMHRSATGQLTRICSVTTALVVRAGDELRIESQTFGTDTVALRMRAWLPGQSVPDWQLGCTATDATRITAPGAVGLGLYSSSTQTLQVADFAVTELSDSSIPSPSSLTPSAGASASTTPSASSTAAPAPSASASAAASSSASATSSAPTPKPSSTTTASPETGPVLTSGATAGALPVGKASYPVPADALHVSPSGNDTAGGASSAPLRTLTAAIAKAPSGRTIVLHGGNYHEAGLKVPEGKKLTIQNAPGEAVWLDGSSRVTGFVASGTTWVRQGWTTQFDASPTFTRGAADSTTEFWQFVNQSYPMAAHPDQVWVNGTRQREVSSASAVVPGTFYVDEPGDRLVLGTNPTGAEVLATTLGDALTIFGSGTTVRGIGVRNYANSVPDMGVVTAYATNVTLENVHVSSPATGGIGLYRAGATLRNVTVEDAGQIAVHGNEADNLTMEGLRIVNANHEHFNTMPAAGGIKVTRSRTVTLRNSQILNTQGNGFWADESTYDIAVVGCDILNSTSRGVFLELSEKAVIVNNRIAGSGDDQVRVANTNRVSIWNNTITGGTVPIHVAQDARSRTTATYAFDRRRPNPDPEMTWIITGTSIGNNVLESNGSISALLLVEDWSKRFTGDQMVSQAESDVYSRASSSPKWVVAWANAASNPRIFTQLTDVVTGLRKETRGQYHAGGSVLAGNGTMRTDVGLVHSKASALPSTVASRAGVSATPGKVGTWR